MDKPLVSVGTALMVTFFGLIAKIAFDLWHRHNERIAVAAAIVGELEAYLIFLGSGDTLAGFKAVTRVSRDQRVALFRTFPPLPTTHPVFDKIADRIGFLSTRDARDVSRVYNVVTGFRLMVTSLGSPAFTDASDEWQLIRLNKFIELMENELPIANALVGRLKGVAKQNRWTWIFPVYD